MAHYAKVVNGIVTQVIVADEEFLETYVDTSPGEYIQTSYNTLGGVHSDGGTPLRKNFAGVGYSYDASKDAFIPPKPFPSWKLNNSTCLWECPVEYPSDGEMYKWNETDEAWDEIESE